MECENFGPLEKRKRAIVYTPDYCVNLVRQTSRRFNVIRMTLDDFKSFIMVDSCVTNFVNGMRKFSLIHIKNKPLHSVLKKKNYNLME